MRPHEDGAERRQRAETLRVDPERSVVRFAIRFMGITTVRGRLHAPSGFVTLSGDLSRCGVRITVPARTLSTDQALRDRHLHSRHYFDTARYPTMEFRGNGTWHADPGWLMQGDLLVAGASQSVTWRVAPLDSSGDGSSPLGCRAFSATGRVSRRAFRMRGTRIKGLNVLLDDLIIASEALVEADIYLTER